MTSDNVTSWTTAFAIALSMAFGFVGGSGSTQRSAKDQNLSGTIASAKKMADGKEWTTANLNVNTSSSYCYDDAEPNCRRYGRLYTWEAAQQGCRLLGDGWRLPTNDEWRHMVLQLCQGAARSLSSTLRREAAGLLRAVHKTVTARQ